MGLNQIRGRTSKELYVLSMLKWLNDIRGGTCKRLRVLIVLNMLRRLSDGRSSAFERLFCSVWQSVAGQGGGRGSV